MKLYKETKWNLQIANLISESTHTVEEALLLKNKKDIMSLYSFGFQLRHFG